MPSRYEFAVDMHDLYDSTGTPRVLVLMAARNGSAWIATQLHSILEQRFVEVRVTISDDASTDNTTEVLSQWRTDSRVEVKCRAAASGSAAQNFFSLIQTANVAECDFVAFSDQDDIWEADKLARGCRILQASGASGYSCASRAFWPDGTERLLAQTPAVGRSDFLFEGAGQGCTFILTKDFFTRLQHFLRYNANLTRPAHYHDWVVYAIARTWRLRWSFDSAPMLRYRQHGANDTGARLSATGVRRRLSLIRCGWYTSQLMDVAAICVAANASDRLLASWIDLLAARKGVRRSVKIALFCARTGRRRRIDNFILICTALLGWI